MTFGLEWGLEVGRQRVTVQRGLHSPWSVAGKPPEQRRDQDWHCEDIMGHELLTSPNPLSCASHHHKPSANLVIDPCEMLEQLDVQIPAQDIVSVRLSSLAP